MKTSLSTYALLAGIAALSVAGTVFHYGLPTFVSTAKTLRCEVTETESLVINGVVQPMPTTTPNTVTVIYQIKGDQWAALSVDGKDGATIVRGINATLGLHHLDVPQDVEWWPLKVTEQTYVLYDKASTDHTDFLSIDRTTGDVSGSRYDAAGGSTLEGRTTGHCTPVLTPIL